MTCIDPKKNLKDVSNIIGELFGKFAELDDLQNFIDKCTLVDWDYDESKKEWYPLLYGYRYKDL